MMADRQLDDPRTAANRREDVEHGVPEAALRPVVLDGDHAAGLGSRRPQRVASIGFTE